MSGEWSEWVSVANWLNKGWNIDPKVPYEKGVYRFRVKLSHPERAGEIVYIGRAGKHGKKKGYAICPRLANFITAAMGFWTLHSGGEKFYKTAADDDMNVAGHRLSVFDLETSWALDDDPECREVEELKRFGEEKPVFNTDEPRTCNREDCPRRRNLRDKLKR